MDIVVTYDVNTLTKEGRRRLRRVAKCCVGCGQRVQWSVFECSVSDVVFERFKQRLLAEIDEQEDSLRIYHLHGGRQDVVESYGRDGYRDFSDPLIL
jgi:CRISPR-associated protein Cas2